MSSGTTGVVYCTDKIPGCNKRNPNTNADDDTIIPIANCNS